MNKYIQIAFENVTEADNELLIALLSEIGFEGFEEEASALKAFIPAIEFNEFDFKQLLIEHTFSYVLTEIEETNWNAVWESNFQPVLVDDFVCIRADFHTQMDGFEHEIVITPKMSFGTGHHATTFMMLQQMKKIDFANKTVFDFGTGTGVLAILAEQLGASKIIACDNDDWSIENTIENLQRNHCSMVEIQKANTAQLDQQVDIILANINKNVILENLPLLSSRLHKNGILLLSGLLNEDEADILKESEAHLLHLIEKQSFKGWIALKMSI